MFWHLCHVSFGMSSSVKIFSGNTPWWTPVEATVEKPSTLLQERLRTAAQLERIHRYESQREGHPCRKMEDDGSYSPDIAEFSHGDGFLMGWSDSVYFFQPTRDEDIVTLVVFPFRKSCTLAKWIRGSADRSKNGRLASCFHTETWPQNHTFAIDFKWNFPSRAWWEHVWSRLSLRFRRINAFKCLPVMS